MSGLTEVEIRDSALWGHMTQVLAQVVRTRPASALAAIAPTSTYILTGNTVPPKSSAMYADTRPIAKTAAPMDSFSNTVWAANTNSALVPLKPPRRPKNGADEMDEEEEVDVEEGEGPKIDLAQHPGEISDVVKEQEYFNMVGAGLPREDALRLLVGLRKLIRSEPLASVRFWGTITGSQSDYYIAECQVDPEREPEGEDNIDEGDLGDDEEDGAMPVSQIADVLFSYAAKLRHSTPREEAGVGLNASSFYVASTSDPTTWNRLPDVTPQQVVVARVIRCTFSGDLDAKVHSHPRFPGTEKHYLRAQIARITSSCQIAPVQLYNADGALPDPEEDDEGRLLPPPTSVPPYNVIPPLTPQEGPDPDDTEAVDAVRAWFHGYSQEELMQGKGWVHIGPTILQCGRVTAPPPPEVEDPEEVAAAQEDEEDGQAAVQAELINPFLSDLSQDQSMSFPGQSRSHFAAWTFRKAYQGEGSRVAVYAAKSLRWPGAITYSVSTKGQPGAAYQMTYFGNGLKNLQGAFFAPQLPPRTLLEYPEEGDVFHCDRDCTVDEELRYAPMPPRPEDEEGDEENDGEEADDY